MSLRQRYSAVGIDECHAPAAQVGAAGCGQGGLSVTFMFWSVVQQADGADAAAHRPAPAGEHRGERHGGGGQRRRHVVIRRQPHAVRGHTGCAGCWLGSKVACTPQCAECTHVGSWLQCCCKARVLAACTSAPLLPADASHSRCGCLRSTLRAEAESWKDRSESLMAQVRELQRQQQVSRAGRAGAVDADQSVGYARCDAAVPAVLRQTLLLRLMQTC